MLKPIVKNSFMLYLNLYIFIFLINYIVYIYLDYSISVTIRDIETVYFNTILIIYIF